MITPFQVRSGTANNHNDADITMCNMELGQIRVRQSWKKPASCLVGNCVNAINFIHVRGKDDSRCLSLERPEDVESTLRGRCGGYDCFILLEIGRTIWR